MSAIAHGWHPTGKAAGIPKKVAVEFHAADAGHKYGKKHRAGGVVKSALRTAHRYKRKAEGGEIDEAPDFNSLKKVYISPHEGIAEDLTKKTPLEGREPTGPVMSAVPQTPRDTIANVLRGPDTKSYEPRSVLADKAMHVLDATPPMQALEAGQNVGKGNFQEAAIGMLPGYKAAKPAADVMNYATKFAITENPKVGQFIFKKLKEHYPKDIATASVEDDLTPEQINNLKTYMTPGAKKAFENHYYKTAPKKEPTFEDFKMPEPTAQSKIVGDKQVWSDPAWEKNFKENYQPPSPVEKPPPEFGTNFGPSINMQNMTKVGDKLGSNEGGVYKGTSGNQYYIKQGQTPDHVKNELIASSLYNAAGVNTLKYHPVQGGNHIATSWANKEKDNAYKFTPEEKAKAQQDFAVHAWLANHDVVGTGGDNLGIVGGKPTVLDNGGALEYRAQGVPKGKLFGTEVGELDSMRGLTPGVHAPDAKKMFGNMTIEQVRGSALSVVGISDQKIKAIVAAHGGDPALADKLIARKDDMAKRLDLAKFDPNFIEKHITAKGDDYEKTLKEVEEAFYGKKKAPSNPGDDVNMFGDSDEDPFKPLTDQELEEQFGKHAPTMDEGYAPHGNSYADSAIEGDFSRWKDVSPLPASTNAWGGWTPHGVPHFRQAIRNGLLSGGEGTIVKPIQNFSDWALPLNVKPVQPKFTEKTAEEVKQLGFNPNVEFIKYTDSPDYPHVLDDPKFKGASSYKDEQAIFMFPHDDMHKAHIYGQKSKPYVLRAEPGRAAEIYWPRLMGEEGFPKEGTSYSGTTIKNLIKAGHEEGLQLIFLHGVSDSGTKNQTQVLVLDTKGTMRGVSAKFNKDKLNPAHPESMRPLVGIAGAAAVGAGAASQNDQQYAKGGKVKEKDPEDHEFIDFKRGGLIDSDIPGRTDKIPMKVTPGSYVLPADIPSALGQGNTKAGSDVLSKMFTHGAYGLKPMTQKAQAPHFDRFRKFADGGETDDHVPIVAAGGEFIIHPDVVKEVGHGDVAKGHKVLDKFVLHTRAQHIKTLKGLKGPKK